MVLQTGEPASRFWNGGQMRDIKCEIKKGRRALSFFLRRYGLSGQFVNGGLQGMTHAARYWFSTRQRFCLDIADQRSDHVVFGRLQSVHSLLAFPNCGKGTPHLTTCYGNLRKYHSIPGQDVVGSSSRYPSPGSTSIKRKRTKVESVSSANKLHKTAKSTV
jgi:hypothetical protein